MQDLREREDRMELEERMVMKIATLMHSILSVLGFGAWKKILKDMCHEIFQNSSNGNCHQIEWNVKKSLKTLIKPGWTDLKTIKRDVNCFSKFNFVFCNVWFNAWETCMFCLTRRHDFVIYMYKSGSFFTNVEFHSEKQMAVLTKWNGQQLWPAWPLLRTF